MSDDRTIMIKGPFTADEVLSIWEVVLPLVRDIERTRPEENFQVLFDDPHTDIAIADLLAKLPIKPGYERITREMGR